MCEGVAWKRKHRVTTQRRRTAIRCSAWQVKPWSRKGPPTLFRGGPPPRSVRLGMSGLYRPESHLSPAGKRGRRGTPQFQESEKARRLHQKRRPPFWNSPAKIAGPCPRSELASHFRMPLAEGDVYITAKLKVTLNLKITTPNPETTDIHINVNRPGASKRPAGGRGTRVRNRALETLPLREGLKYRPRSSPKNSGGGEAARLSRFRVEYRPPGRPPQSVGDCSS